MTFAFRILLSLGLIGATWPVLARETRERVAGVDARVERELAYGPGARQRLDLYLPADATPRALIVLVHGGGWKRGDKRSPGVVENKLARWLPQGYALASVNYRMLPDARPDVQVQDVARALAFAQSAFQRHGGDPARSVLMGHSAGAHLVALLAASPELERRFQLRPWRATVSLDSAAMDVVGLMSRPHLALYDAAFGGDRAYWAQVSPLAALSQRMPPLLAVCSSARRQACPHNRALVDKAIRLGGTAELLAVPMSHAEINRDLGLDSDYTRRVETFIARALDAR